MRRFLVQTLDYCIGLLLLVAFIIAAFIVFAPVIALIKFSLMYLMGG